MLDYSVPITEVNFDNTRLGAKSTEKKQANDQELEYRRRLYKAEATLTPDEIRSLVYETNQRRTLLEESIRQRTGFQNSSSSC
jgi:hypothetical protein